MCSYNKDDWTELAKMAEVSNSVVHQFNDYLVLFASCFDKYLYFMFLKYPKAIIIHQVTYDTTFRSSSLYDSNVVINHEISTFYPLSSSGNVYIEQDISSTWYLILPPCLIDILPSLRASPGFYAMTSFLGNCLHRLTKPAKTFQTKYFYMSKVQVCINCDKEVTYSWTHLQVIYLNYLSCCLLPYILGETYTKNRAALSNENMILHKK